jgi:hypothetical protein
MPGVYADKGPADPDALIRGLIAFPIRNRGELEALIRDLYDPASPNFRRYLTPDEWVARFAPPAQDVNLVAQFMRDQGLSVPRIAKNRLLLQFTGTVARFNQTFGTALRVLERKSPQMGNDPHDVFGIDGPIHAPKYVVDRIAAIVAADLAVPQAAAGRSERASAPRADRGRLRRKAALRRWVHRPGRAIGRHHRRRDSGDRRAPLLEDVRHQPRRPTASHPVP